MRLSVDDRGLKYEIDLPDTQEARSIRSLVSRGDLRGSSFGFRATGENWSVEGAKEVRTITDVELKDVGPVSLPAYTATDVQARNAKYGEEALRMAEYAIEHRHQSNISKIEELRQKAAESQRQVEEAVAAEILGPGDEVPTISDEDRIRNLRLISLRCSTESYR
jgi:hypothetical protein